MARSLEAVVAGIKLATRNEMLKDFRPDCCIATTQAVNRVLRHFGYFAHPLPVRVMVFNPTYVEAFRDGTAKTQDDSGWREWMDSVGAWSVGVGFPDGSPGFAGHLISVLPKHGLFIDASLNQADRPAKDILLPPVFVSEVTSEFMMTAGMRLEFECSNGAGIIYERIDTTDWRRSPDWKSRMRTDRAVAAIIRHIENT